MNKFRQTIGKNPSGGRDFVIGDLHGAYERLMQLMEHVSFDKTKDRMFSVGDLVDRGPESVKCLMLVYEPWFFSVTGNHEQLMYDYFTGGPYGMFWVQNGGSWGTIFKEYPSDEAMVVKDAVKKVAEQPLMLTVEMESGKFFHVIHAELAGIEPLTDSDLEDEAKFNEAAFHQTMDGDFIIWGRFIFYSLYGVPLDEARLEKFKRTAEHHKMGAIFNPELSHIYSGHTIMRQPVRFKGQTNLDTGAYSSIRPTTVSPYSHHHKDIPEWAGLTMTEPLTDRFWTAKETGVTEVTPVILG